MVLERAEIFIQPGRMEEFLTMFRAEALPLTRTFTGCLSFRTMRGVEDADSVTFLAEWESIEAHLESRQEETHERFRELVLPWISGSKPTVHFVDI